MLRIICDSIKMYVLNSDNLSQNAHWNPANQKLPELIPNCFRENMFDELDLYCIHSISTINH